MKQYVVKASYIYNVDVLIRAKNKKQAKEMVQEHCSFGYGLENGFHSSLKEDVLIDWYYLLKPDMKLDKVYVFSPSAKNTEGIENFINP